MPADQHGEITYLVQNTIGAYTQALDAGQADAVAELFTENGTSDITGVGVFTGRAQLREGYAKLTSDTPARHLVANVVVTAISDTEASSSSDFVFLARGEQGWGTVVTGHYVDSFALEDGTWRIAHRTTTYA
ncbi:MAG: nuclear transport factor 2 family protein [Gordonia sp. (in: high G+C Gram-positive bacteria)]